MAAYHCRRISCSAALSPVGLVLGLGPRRVGRRTMPLGFISLVTGFPEVALGLPPFPGHSPQPAEQGGGEEGEQQRDQRPAPARAGEPRDRPHRPRRHRLPLPEALQVLGQRQGAGVATAGLLLQAVQRDRLQVARQAGLQAARPGRLVGRHRPQQLQGAVALERQLPREELIEHHPQGVDVRRRPHQAPPSFRWPARGPCSPACRPGSRSASTSGRLRSAGRGRSR